MGGNRVLFYDNEQVKGQAGSRRLRIRTLNGQTTNQWFKFDSRTRTVRSASDANLVISNEQKQAFRIGRFAVVRPFVKEHSHEQTVWWHSGPKRNLRNSGGVCLDVWKGINRDLQPITWWNCHNGDNQAWFLNLAGKGQEIGT